MARVFISIVAILISLPAAAGEKIIAFSAAQRAALRVVSSPLASQTGPIATVLPARVTVPPSQERVVSVPVAGAITEVRVAAGDAVKAGQTLAVLRGEELVSAQRDITQAAVQVRLAEETARRDEALFKEGIIAESRLQSARAGLAQARASLMERRAWLRLMGLSAAAIKAAEAGTRYTDSIALAAPAAGTVLEQTALAGARVEPGSPLFKVVRLDPLWLEVQAPSQSMAAIRVGQKVEVRDSGTSGVVVSVGRDVSAAQTVTIRARMSNADGRLRLNQSVSVSLAGAGSAQEWRLPAQAVVRQAGRSWVFDERAGGFEPVPGNVLSQAANAVAVSGPFDGREKVAVQGVAALKSAWQGGGE